MKIGGGLQYLAPRKLDADNSPKFSWLPIYATVQVNPIKAAPEVYFKGDIGYNIIADDDFEYTTEDYDSNIVKGDTERKGGLYWALGAGYEFPFGLVLDLSYGFYYSTTEVKYQYDFLGDVAREEHTFDNAYSKLTLSVGYKFKI
ncbi:MAG: hypothetical protein LBQ47_04870 [Endomicrobium sp.]|nr:hypothetical protein [Endomicrobium sp.]